MRRDADAASDLSGCLDSQGRYDRWSKFSPDIYTQRHLYRLDIGAYATTPNSKSRPVISIGENIIRPLLNGIVQYFPMSNARRVVLFMTGALTCGRDAINLTTAGHLYQKPHFYVNAYIHNAIKAGNA